MQEERMAFRQDDAIHRSDLFQITRRDRDQGRERMLHLWTVDGRSWMGRIETQVGSSGGQTVVGRHASHPSHPRRVPPSQVTEHLQDTSVCDTREEYKDGSWIGIRGRSTHTGSPFPLDSTGGVSRAQQDSTLR